MIRRYALMVFATLAGSGFAVEPHGVPAVVKQYCYDCHDGDAQKGDLNLEALKSRDFAKDSAAWEKVVRKMNARQMPPIGKPRPDERT
ncbi:MAG: c-type cytochrome domain-containing protein, partial [Limisphaerales bacterium]